MFLEIFREAIAAWVFLLPPCGFIRLLRAALCTVEASSIPRVAGSLAVYKLEARTWRRPLEAKTVRLRPREVHCETLLLSWSEVTVLIRLVFVA